MALSLPLGFSLGVASAGFKKTGRPDLALAVSAVPAAAAGVFTTNLFKAAPVIVGQAMLATRQEARAVLLNAGQANACTGAAGLADCRASLALAGEAAGIDPQDILPASTGVIGNRLKLDLWEQAVPALAANLGNATVEEFARAIMTTDRFPKFASEKVRLGTGTVTLTGVAKGAGMICPDMATMLSVLLCDAKVDPADWQAMFVRAVDRTFNRVSVDGDTSTNDTLYGLANGMAGVNAAGADLDLLEQALVRVLGELARMLVQDGEGATKVMRITVRGAASDGDAEIVARTVGHSQLVKTAMYGKDANWGRIVAAMGRSGVTFDPAGARVSVCGVEIFRDQQPTDADVDVLLKDALEQQDIPIDIQLGAGPGLYTLLASDLTHEYVSINADYRS